MSALFFGLKGTTALAASPHHRPMSGGWGHSLGPQFVHAACLTMTQGGRRRFHCLSRTSRRSCNLGSMRYPDAPIQGYTQAYWRALQALGIANSASHDIGVDLLSYGNSQFAVMITTEKVEGVMSSGQNLQGGQECRFSVKNFAEGDSLPRRCYFCLEYDCILELKAGSVTLLN